jgi:2-polyprenyl-3-methyl-5-hydroxy-6-metoxy-1,4-benzoquinol methylase
MNATEGPEIDVDELAARTRAQLARRQSTQRSRSAPLPVPSSPELPQHGSRALQPPIVDRLVKEVSRPERVQLNLPEPCGIVYKAGFETTIDGHYHVRDLLQYNDRDFIHAAYRALMRRPPDAEGLANYLGHLRLGMAKIEVLETLRDSPEGRRVAARVAGLSLRSSLLKIYRWPLIGPLIRFANTLFSLSEVQRSQNALQGQIIARMEEGQLNARDAQLVLHSALRELQGAHVALLDYAASKPDQHLIREVDTRVAQSIDGLAALQKSLEVKASREDLQHAVSQLQGSLQFLEGSKAEMEDLHRTERGLSEVSAALHMLNASKADRSSLNEACEQLIRALDTRPERHELMELADHLREKSDTRDLLRTEERLSEVASALKNLTLSKADRSSVEETRQELIQAIETKPERYELTELTNHLVSIAQSRVNKSDIAPLQESHETIVRQATEDRAAFKSAQDQTNDALQGVHGALASIAQSKADRRMVEELRYEINTGVDGALENLRLTTSALLASKADASSLQSAKAEFAASMNGALENLRQTTSALLALKADASSLQSTKEDLAAVVEASRTESDVKQKTELQEMNRKIELIAQSQVTDGTARTELSKELHSSLKYAIDEARAAIKSLSESKADRASIDAAHTKLIATIDTARADAATGIQSATQVLGQHIESLLQTKASRDALEQVRADLKGTLETNLSVTTQKVTGLSHSKADIASLEASVAEMKSAVDAVHKRSQEALVSALSPLAGQIQDAKRNILDQERRLGLLLEEARKRFPKPMSARQLKTIVAEDTHLLDAMYASFEDRFRGTRADIKQRAMIYLPYIRAAKAGTTNSPIVDLGCGRGEWLEVLRDEGLVGRGVDTNRVFLHACQEMSLDVTGSDALQYLRDLKPSSVGAITSFHLIEHLPMKVLIAMIDESLRVLKPGGIVVLETPNPENLQVGACNFYTDPTHRNPMPPVLTESLLELRGFVRPLIVRRDQEKMRSLAPPHVATGQPLAANINPIVEVMLSNFFVSPDYAVVAKKA